MGGSRLSWIINSWFKERAVLAGGPFSLLVRSRRRMIDVGRGPSFAFARSPGVVDVKIFTSAFEIGFVMTCCPRSADAGAF